MTETEFHIGDRVASTNPILNGAIGMVIAPEAIVPIGSKQLRCVGVFFDEAVPFGHNLDGLCEGRHGLYFFPNELRLVEKAPPELPTPPSDTDVLELFGKERVTDGRH